MFYSMSTSDTPAAPAYSPDPTTRAHLRALTRRHHPDEVWAAARMLYAEGESGQVVRERYGIGRTAFYRRMKSEGWRRRDAEAADGLVHDPVETGGSRPAIEVAADCWDLMCRAVDRGRLGEARGWGRLYMDLRRVARMGQICWIEGVPELEAAGEGEADAGANSPAALRADLADSLFLPPEGQADLEDRTDLFPESAA